MWFIHFKFRRFSAVSETGGGDGISWKGGGRGEELKNRPRTFYNVRLEICFASCLAVRLGRAWTRNIEFSWRNAVGYARRVFEIILSLCR